MYICIYIYIYRTISYTFMHDHTFYVYCEFMMFILMIWSIIVELYCLSHVTRYNQQANIYIYIYIIQYHTHSLTLTYLHSCHMYCDFILISFENVSNIFKLHVLKNVTRYHQWVNVYIYIYIYVYIYISCNITHFHTLSYICMHFIFIVISLWLVLESWQIIFKLHFFKCHTLSLASEYIYIYIHKYI